MRKLKKSTVGLIVVVMSLILACFGAFAFVSIKQTQEKDPGFELTSGTIIYNNSSNPIKITSDGSIKKDGKKYVAYLNSGKEYDLGEHTMIYTGRTLKVFGGGYQIDKYGDIVKVDDSFEFTDFANGSIFKLCDRKYLLASSLIEDSNNKFTSQESFMYIVMDTVGNAKLSSATITLRSTEPTVLNTENFKFDVANELLEINGMDEKMALGNLICSTNTYDSGKYKTIDEDDTPDDIYVDVYGGNGGDGGNAGNGGNGADGGDGGNGADGGNGGNGADGGNGGNGADGGDGGSGGLGNDQQVVAYIVNKRITVTATTLTCDYYFEDPFGKLGAIYIELHKYADLPERVKKGEVSMNDFVLDDDGEFEEYWEHYNSDELIRYQCNFYDKQTVFKNLEADTMYYIFLCRYYENSTTEETEFELVDCTSRKTLPYQSKVNITLLGPDYVEVEISLETLDSPAKRVVIPNSAYGVTLSEEEIVQAVESKITKTIEITGESEFMRQTQFIEVQVVDDDDNVICQTSTKNNFFTGNTI